MVFMEPNVSTAMVGWLHSIGYLEIIGRKGFVQGGMQLG